MVKRLIVVVLALMAGACAAGLRDLSLGRGPRQPSPKTTEGLICAGKDAEANDYLREFPIPRYRVLELLQDAHTEIAKRQAANPAECPAAKKE